MLARQYPLYEAEALCDVDGVDDAVADDDGEDDVVADVDGEEDIVADVDGEEDIVADVDGVSDEDTVTDAITDSDGVTLGGSSLIFDPLGRLVTSAKAVQGAVLSITVSNQTDITVQPETGYVQ